MIKCRSRYPSLSADVSGRAVVSHAGAVALLRTAERTGLTGGLSAALARWVKPLAVHDPGKVVCDLAVALAVGGDCLADVGVLRAEPGVFGAVASDPTVSRCIAALADEAPKALAAIALARAQARSAAWAGASERAPDHGVDAERPLVIDIDATLVTAHSDKESAAPDVQAGLRFSPVVRVCRPRPRRHGSAAGDPFARG